MNNLTLSGRLTRAIRSNNVSGTPVVNFTTAFEVGMKPQKATINGREQLVIVPATAYIECAAWGQDAIAAATLEAGQQVTVTITALSAKGRAHDGKIYSSVQARVADVTPGAKARSSVSAEPSADDMPLLR